MTFEEALKDIKVGQTVHIDGYRGVSVVTALEKSKMWLHNLHATPLAANSGYTESLSNGSRYLIDSIFVDGVEVVRDGFQGSKNKKKS